MPFIVLDAFVERQIRTVRGNQILIALRLLMATVSLTVLMIQDIDLARKLGPIFTSTDPLYLRPPGLVAIIICALTIVYLLALRKTENNPSLAPVIAFIQVFVDIFLISALIWNTGGVDSQFVVLYLISICAAAFVLKWNVAIIAAAVAATLFSLVALLYSINFVPEIYSQHAAPAQLERLRNLTILDFIRLLLLPVCAFFLTGFLAGTLSRTHAVTRLMHDEILESIGEGILVVDSDRRALYHNRELLRLLNLEGPIEGKFVTELLGEAIDGEAREVYAARFPKRIEHNVPKGNGKLVPFMVRIAPINEPGAEKPRGLILSFDDITAEKKMEEFLKHRQRIETMGHISATIAHEIRNPLASIRGAVQEIGRAVQISENKKVLLDIVLSESDRLDQIITDFLRFARMRPPKLAPADIGRVLADVKLLLTSRPEAKNVQITLAGDEGDPFPADSEQLRQLFLNLGVNALQAMNGSQKNELNIRVRVTNLYEAPGFSRALLMDRIDRPGVLIEVHDTGKGMPPEICQQIFEPFFTTKSAGTGLGLAIVERIVQTHEGLVTVSSEVGKGTTFRVWLPTDLKQAASFSGPRPAVV